MKPFNMSKRLPNNENPSRSAGGLTNSLESLHRTRGSSATPMPSGSALLSPHPQRDIKNQLENIDRTLRHTFLGQGNSLRNIMATNRGDSSGQGAPRQPSQGSESCYSNLGGVKLRDFSPESVSHPTQRPHQDMVFNKSPAGPSLKLSARQVGVLPGNSRYVVPNELAAKFRAKLMELQQLIHNSTSIPKNIQEDLKLKLRKLSHEFEEGHRNIQDEADRFNNDLRLELEAVRQGYSDLELKYKKSSERFKKAESEWKLAQDDLNKQIALQKEQLQGKGALWLDTHPGSSARRNATTIIRDPLDSPSASEKPSYPGRAMSNATSPSVANLSHNARSSKAGPHKMKPVNPGGFNASVYGTSTHSAGGHNSGGNIGSSGPGSFRNKPPTGPRRIGTLPAQMPMPQAYTASTSFPPPLPSAHYLTEPGSPRTSNALVVHKPKTDEELALEFKGATTKLYELIENWSRNYANVPNPRNDRAIASSNDILWDYMMNCTYPGHRQDSHTHVVTLLNDPNTRYWFVMRMATQYCVKDVMSIKAFKPYNRSIANTIDTVILKLQERGLNNEARQQYIDQGSEAVRAVLDATDYLTFRARQLNVHTKALRDMVGPMLSDGVERAHAGRDIGAIAVHSWDLSASMHSARLTFQIYFPETAAKFTAATMKAKDKTNIDPMQLQIQQTRLKLVITPVITMRDDRGTTIKAKSLQASNVLLMA